MLVLNYSNNGKSVTASEVDDLCGCSHEEADTRLLLHAIGMLSTTGIPL